MQYIKLNNGVKIPRIGYGVYMVDPSITKQCVSNALKVGYRHIDTSFFYGNEEEVGKAIKESLIPRNEIFLTTKITGAKDYDEACSMIDKALNKLQVDYIDLMLIHWPSGDNLSMYRAMEEYYKQGKLRAIGLSNFYDNELENILKKAKIKPVVNQIETHVFRNQKKMQEYLGKNDIILESWSPLARGENNIFDNKILTQIAKKHGKSVAQVALRYLYERDIILIPRTTNINRMKENIDILDFSLDSDDIRLIDSLDTDKSLFGLR